MLPKITSLYMCSEGNSDWSEEACVIETINSPQKR